MTGRTYCALLISSDSDPQLAETVQSALGLTGGESVDTQTPDLVARRARLAQILHAPVPSPPRYFWRLSSKDAVDDVDPESHVEWLLSGLKPGRTMDELRALGCTVRVTCFWGDNGRGGGPVLSAKLLRTLAAQGVPLEFDFYVEEVESNGKVH
jgi:hypothetical protein